MASRLVQFGTFKVGLYVFGRDHNTLKSQVADATSTEYFDVKLIGAKLRDGEQFAIWLECETDTKADVDVTLLPDGTPECGIQVIVAQYRLEKGRWLLRTPTDPPLPPRQFVFRSNQRSFYVLQQNERFDASSFHGMIQVDVYPEMPAYQAGQELSLQCQYRDSIKQVKCPQNFQVKELVRHLGLSKGGYLTFNNRRLTEPMTLAQHRIGQHALLKVKDTNGSNHLTLARQYLASGYEGAAGYIEWGHDLQLQSIPQPAIRRLPKSSRVYFKLVPE